MSKIFVSGLVNIETTVKVRKFPVDYYPIDYPFFGVNSNVAGVGYNIAKALSTLGDDVTLCSMTGMDFEREKILFELNKSGIQTDYIKPSLKETPSSAILYDDSGKRQIYCDLKDIQETEYDFKDEFIDSQLVIACNINFNRPLLRKAKASGKLIATDVHVLSDINDEYNKDFMENADILFLSDEGAGENPSELIKAIYNAYGNKIIVMGMGGKGALLAEQGVLCHLPAINVENVVNTVGAGDSLFSSFLHYYAKGLSPVDCLWRAQIFASEKIKANGASNGFIEETTVEKIYKDRIESLNCDKIYAD